MKHSLPPIEKSILLGAAADLAQLRKTPRPTGYGELALKAACYLASRRIVKTDPADWLGGEVSPSTRMAVSRAYQRLESRKLVERVAMGAGAATTHLELTPAGVKLAKELRG